MKNPEKGSTPTPSLQTSQTQIRTGIAHHNDAADALVSLVEFGKKMLEQKSNSQPVPPHQEIQSSSQTIQAKQMIAPATEYKNNKVIPNGREKSR